MDSQRLIRVIAEREFMTRIRSRVFAITTVLTVIGIAGYILLQAYVLNKSAASLDVGFAGTAQSIAAPARAEAASFGETINVHRYTSAAAGKADVQRRFARRPRQRAAHGNHRHRQRLARLDAPDRPQRLRPRGGAQ